MEKFVWFRPNFSKFEHIVQEDKDKIQFQREVGFFLGTIEDRYKLNPQNCLEKLDEYYKVAKNGLESTELQDPWSLMYFRALAELLANFIQTFRATKGLPPSPMINADLQEVQLVRA